MYKFFTTNPNKMKRIALVIGFALALLLTGCVKETFTTDSVEHEIHQILQESGHRDLQAWTIQDIKDMRSPNYQNPNQLRNIEDSVANFTCIRVDDQYFAPTSNILINVIGVYGTSVIYSPYDTNGDQSVDAADLLDFVAGYGVFAEGVDFFCWEEAQYFNEGQSEMAYTCPDGDFFFGWLLRTPSDEPDYEPTTDTNSYDVNSFDFEAIGFDVISYTYVK